MRVCLQAVRPHAPLIKFPKRQDVARPNGEYEESEWWSDSWHNINEGTHPKIDSWWNNSNLNLHLQLAFTFYQCMMSDIPWVLLELPFICNDFFPPVCFLVQEALKTLAVNASPHNAPAPPPLSRPHVPLTPISGTPDTLASIQLLPARYRRRPMAVDEMDYIQVRDHLHLKLYPEHFTDNLAF